MSLINQLLKDLAAREKQSHAIPIDQHGRAVLQRLTGLSFSHDSLKKTAALFFSALFVLGGMGWYLNHLPTIKVAPPLNVSQPKNAVATNNLILPQSNMGEARIKDAYQEVNIIIPFDHLPLYRLDAYPDQERISIYFDHTHIPDTFQPIINHSSGLKGLNYLQMGQDARLDLDISDGLQVKDIFLKGNELNIHFKKLKPALNATNQENVSVKQFTQGSLLKIRYDEAIQKIQAGDFINAEQELFSILETAPEYLSARVALIALALEQHEETGAQRLIKRGLELSPQAPDLLSLKAEILIRHQKIDEAIQVLTSETPDFVKYPDFYAQLANAYLQKNNYQKAFHIYQALTQRAAVVKPAWQEGMQLAAVYLQKNPNAHGENAA